MSAGTDAHGDFNYESAADATALGEINDVVPDAVLELIRNPDTLTLTGNAYGRARTYTLTSDRVPPLSTTANPPAPSVPLP